MVVLLYLLFDVFCFPVIVVVGGGSGVARGGGVVVPVV